MSDSDISRANDKYTGRQRLLDCNQIPRKIKYEVDTDTIKVEVETQDEFEKEGPRKGLKCESDLDIRLETKDEDGLDARMSLKAQNGDAKVRFGFRFRIEEIVEFVDSNKAIPGWDANDTTVQTYTVGRGMNKDGKRISRSDPDAELWNKYNKDNKTATFIADPANPGCYSFTADTTKKTFAAIGRFCNKPQVTFTKDSGREFKDRYNVTRNITLNYKLSPNAVKFDFLVNNFPYLQADTKLAIKGKLITKSNFKIRHIGKVLSRPDQDELDVADGQGGFSWAKTVLADGEKVPVTMTKAATDAANALDNSETDRYYAFTFEKVGKVKNFIWDPEMAGDMGGIGQSSAAGVAPGLFAGVVSLVAFFL